MRKFILFLSLVSGILYGLKTSFYLEDYDGLLVVLFIVCAPLIISAVIADLIHQLRERNLLNALPRFILNTAISVGVVFLSMYIVNAISERIYSQQMKSKAEEMIIEIDQYKEQNQKLPVGLYQLESVQEHEFMYTINQDSTKFKLGYISSRSIYDSKRVNYEIYSSQSKEWISTDRSSKLGF